MRTVVSPQRITTIQKTIAGMQEKQTRLYLGNVAIELGYGAISALSKALECSRGMIARGVNEVKAGEVFNLGDRNRKPGAGRKPLSSAHAKAMQARGKTAGPDDLENLIISILEGSAYGDCMSFRKWINITVKEVTEEVLRITGQKYSHSSIKRYIRKYGYSLQKNQKYDQVGKPNPMRNEQFLHIAQRKADYLNTGDPVISIDTKAKEKLGDFINSGHEYRKIGCPRRVLDHDFAYEYSKIYPNGSSLVPDEWMSHRAIVIPNGVYCLNNNSAHVTVGISHDTSEFAADSICNWWNARGKKEFPHATRVLILADGGGSNRVRGWLWKLAVQQIADNTGLVCEVCHYTAGCSKYNPIERRLWSQVSHSWTAKPLQNLELVQFYIAHTGTQTGLSVSCEINSDIYLTEQEKAKQLSSGTEPRGIAKSDALIQAMLFESLGDNDELKKLSYIIRPHPEEKRWHNYKMGS